MMSRDYPAIERLPEEPFVIEQAFGRFVHREFPVLIARVKQAKRQREQWGVSRLMGRG